MHSIAFRTDNGSLSHSISLLLLECGTPVQNNMHLPFAPLPLRHEQEPLALKFAGAVAASHFLAVPVRRIRRQHGFDVFAGNSDMQPR